MEKKAAFEDKKFAAFLDSDPDKASFDPSNEKQVRDQWGKFQLKNDVVTGLHDIYKDKIKKDAGVELSADDLGAVDDFLSAEARVTNS